MSRTAKPLTRPTLSQLRRSLPHSTRELFDATRTTAQELGMDLWAVGGAIRDLAANQPLSDLDVVCSGNVEALAAITSGKLTAEWKHEPRFATAQVEHLRGHLDISALRSEHYPRPGALPQVRVGVPLEIDLLRRDFTINAIALALTGPDSDKLFDPLHGLQDLEGGSLKALHANSFRDDATRLWRGAQYAVELKLRPDSQTAQWIADAPRWIAPISGRRIWSELINIATRRQISPTIRLLDKWGAFVGVHSEWSQADQAAQALSRRPGPHPPFLLIAVLLGNILQPEAILNRLAAPKAIRRIVNDTGRLLTAHDSSPHTLTGIENSHMHARNAALWLEPNRQQSLQRDLRRWERTNPPLDAAALQSLGVEPGPALGTWLASLRRSRYLGTLNDATSARKHVQARLEEA